jgi:hypothetical protein
MACIVRCVGWHEPCRIALRDHLDQADQAERDQEVEGRPWRHGAERCDGRHGDRRHFEVLQQDRKRRALPCIGAEAADSTKLGGIAANEYTGGKGAQGGRWQALLNKGEEPNFLNVPEIGLLSVKCSLEGAKITTVKLTQHAGGGVFYTWASYPEKVASKVETGLLQNDDEALEQSLTSTEHGGGQMIIQASALVAGGDAFADITISAATTEGECRVQANYTVAES